MPERELDELFRAWRSEPVPSGCIVVPVNRARPAGRLGAVVSVPPAGGGTLPPGVSPDGLPPGGWAIPDP